MIKKDHLILLVQNLEIMKECLITNLKFLTRMGQKALFYLSALLK